MDVLPVSPSFLRTVINIFVYCVIMCLYGSYRLTYILLGVLIKLEPGALHNQTSLCGVLCANRQIE